MRFSNLEVFNIRGALRGMRNPKESWDRGDSLINEDGCCEIGPNDMRLAQTLILAGTEHAKFMRQIFVTVDITAPLYWWKEFDTYKVGTTANSTSTMHKIASKPITLSCFETKDYDERLSLIDPINLGVRVDLFIDDLEQLRQLYLINLEESRKHKDNPKEQQKYANLAKSYWKELIRWLPEGWLQTRTVTMSYANLRNIYFQRRFHKLTEWSKDFMNFIDTLPYTEELIKIERMDANV